MTSPRNDPFFEFSAIESYAPACEADVRFAFERGWFGPEDAVRIFLEWLSAGRPLSEAAEQIALLLRDEYDTRHGANASLVEDVYEMFDYDLSLLPLVPPLRPNMPSPDDLRTRLRGFAARERAWAGTREGRSDVDH